jgi:hypothetical protein
VTVPDELVDDDERMEGDILVDEGVDVEVVDDEAGV